MYAKFLELTELCPDTAGVYFGQSVRVQTHSLLIIIFHLLFKSLCGSFTLDHNPKRGGGVPATKTFSFLREGGKYSVTPLTANDRWLYGAAGFATVPGDEKQTQLSRRPSASKSCKLVRTFAVKRTDRARSL